MNRASGPRLPPGSSPSSVPPAASGTVERAQALLETLVRLESPTSDPEAVGRVLDLYAEALEEVGARLHPRARGSASAVVADFPGDWVDIQGGTSTRAAGGAGREGRDGTGHGSLAPEERPLLVVGHLDTVHPRGTLAGPLPLRADGDRLHGPGVYDMKGGLAAFVGALAHLAAIGRVPGLPLRILVTPDEETGSAQSRPLLEAEARRARGALVLEPPLPEGGPKIRRKGVGEVQVRIRGVPAHAGIEPARGASAIHALGVLLPALLALADPARGTTVNVGRVEGGGPVNVVADRVDLQVDLRVATAAEQVRLEAGLADLVRRARAGLIPGLDPRIRLEVDGGIDRPPMEPGPGSLALLQVAQEVAASLGRPSFEGGATGGGSDGNLLSAAGCPVLDGLGIRGDGAHTHEEWIDLEDLAWRVAFLAGLLVAVDAEVLP